MIHVYLAGPIEGCNEKEIHNWRDYVAEGLALFDIKAINPYRGSEVVNKGGYDRKTAQKIIQKNKLDCDRCDGLFAYMPTTMLKRRPSYGTAFELAWFAETNKPVVIVSDCDTFVNHPAIMGQFGYVFDNLEEGIKEMCDLLSVYTE